MVFILLGTKVRASKIETKLFLIILNKLKKALFGLIIIKKLGIFLKG